MKALAALLLVTSSVAVSAEPAKSDTEKAAKPKPVKICQQVVPTGSMLPVKTCRTKEQWDNLSASGQGALRQVKDASHATMGTAPDL